MILGIFMIFSTGGCYKFRIRRLMDFMIPRVNFYMIFMDFYNPSMDFIRFLGILEFLAGGCYKLSHIKRFYVYRSSNVEARTRNG